MAVFLGTWHSLVELCRHGCSTWAVERDRGSAPMTLAGLRHVVGGFNGGKITDKFVPGLVVGFGQLICRLRGDCDFPRPRFANPAILTFICAWLACFARLTAAATVKLGEAVGETWAMVQIALTAVLGVDYGVSLCAPDETTIWSLL